MTNLPLVRSIRTLSISETPSTLLSDEHQEAPEGLEDLETLTEDQMPQEGYPLPNSFLFNLQET